VVSARRAGAPSGRPPIFSGRASKVDAQPASANASAIARRLGAKSLRRAFDIMQGHVHCNAQRQIIHEGGFKEVYPANMSKQRTKVLKPRGRQSVTATHTTAVQTPPAPLPVAT